MGGYSSHFHTSVSVLPFPYFGFHTSAFSTCPQTSTTTLECNAPLLCHKKPFLKHCCIPYSINFHESLNLQILWIFNLSQKCITKIYYTRQTFFMLWQQDCQWQDPVVSIALLTVANSSGQQFSDGCLINLACMPHPTVHGMRIAHKNSNHGLSICLILIYMLSRSRYYFFVMLWA